MTDDKVSSSDTRLEITNGHLTTKQTTTTTTFVATGGNSGSVSDQTDMAGKISLTADGLVPPGSQCTITFGLPYAAVPNIQLTATNATAGINSVGTYITATTNDFTVNFAIGSVADTYTWNYFIIQTL
jgi:hypothetical protein